MIVELFAGAIATPDALSQIPKSANHRRVFQRNRPTAVVGPLKLASLDRSFESCREALTRHRSLVILLV